MNLLRRFITNLQHDFIEYYVGVLLVLAIPATIAWFTELRWGVLLSLVIQAVIGILYLRGVK